MNINKTNILRPFTLITFYLGLTLSHLSYAQEEQEVQNKQEEAEQLEQEENKNEKALIDINFPIYAATKNNNSYFSLIDANIFLSLKNLGNGPWWVGAELQVGYITNKTNTEEDYLANSLDKFMVGPGIPIYQKNGTIVGFALLVGQDLNLAIKPKIVLLTRKASGEISLTNVFFSGKDAKVFNLEFSKFTKHFVFGARHTTVFDQQEKSNLHISNVFADVRIKKGGIRIGPELGLRNKKGYAGIKLSFNLCDGCSL